MEAENLQRPASVVTLFERDPPWFFTTKGPKQPFCLKFRLGFGFRNIREFLTQRPDPARETARRQGSKQEARH